MGWLGGVWSVIKDLVVAAGPHIAKHGTPIVAKSVGYALDDKIRNSKIKGDVLLNLNHGIEELERKLEQESNVSDELRASIH